MYLPYFTLKDNITDNVDYTVEMSGHYIKFYSGNTLMSQLGPGGLLLPEITLNPSSEIGSVYRDANGFLKIKYEQL